MKHILDLPRRFDDWCLARTADGLVLLHEWLDLSRSDVIRLCVVFEMGFAIASTIHDHAWWAMFVWPFFGFSDWNQAPAYNGNLKGDYRGFRCFEWPMSIYNCLPQPTLIGGFWFSMLSMSYLKDAPMPPSDRGRRRKALLAKLKFRQFEPVPQT